MDSKSSEREVARLQALARIAAAAGSAGGIDAVAKAIANGVQSAFGLRVVLNLLDPSRDVYVVRSVVGEGLEPLLGTVNPSSHFDRVLDEGFEVAPDAYFISHSENISLELLGGTHTAEHAWPGPGFWHPDDLCFIRMRTSAGRRLGILSIDSPIDRPIPSRETMDLLRLFGMVGANVIENVQLAAEVAQLEAEGEVQRLRLQVVNRDRSFEAQYQAIPIPTYTWRRARDTFVLIDYNKAAARTTEGRVNEWMGRTSDEMYRDVEQIRRGLARCFEDHEPFQEELRYRFRTTGKVRRLRVSYAFVPPDLVVVHADDIEEQRRQEESLQRAESRYRTLVEQVPAVIYVWDAVGGVEKDAEHFVSARIRSILGFSPEEWMANPSYWFDRVYEDDRQAVIDETDRCVEAGIDFSLDYRMVARDGHIVWLHDEAIVLSKDERGRVAQFQGILLDVSEHHQIIDRLREVDGQRRRLLAGLVSAQEEERMRIAGDIHDDPIQKMTAVGMRLDLVRRAHPELASDQGFASLTSSVQVAIARLRHLMFDLRPYMLDGDGLATALQAYLGEQEKLGSGPVYSLESQWSSEPQPDIRITMYRIVQEALTNIRKHAHATKADVRLLEGGDGYLVEVHDDGDGFSIEGKADSPLGHLGLTTMRERAEMAGGWLRVSSEPGRGTTVRVWLPSRDGATSVQLAS